MTAERLVELNKVLGEGLHHNGRAPGEVRALAGDDLLAENTWRYVPGGHVNEAMREFTQWYNASSSTQWILVGVEAAYSAITAGPVEVEFYRDPIPAGDSCSTAFDVDEGSLPYTDSIDLWQYGPAWPMSVCSLNLRLRSSTNRGWS